MLEHTRGRRERLPVHVEGRRSSDKRDMGGVIEQAQLVVVHSNQEQGRVGGELATVGAGRIIVGVENRGVVEGANLRRRSTLTAKLWPASPGIL